MVEDFEKIIRENVREIFLPKGRKNVKSLTKTLAKISAQIYLDVIHQEVLPFISSCSLKEIPIVWSQINGLKYIASLSDNLIFDEILKRKDLVSIHQFQIEWFLFGIDEDRFIQYINRLIQDCGSDKALLLSKMDEIILKKIVEIKNLKQYPEIIDFASFFILNKLNNFNSEDKNSNSVYYIERLLPSIAVLANHNDDVKKIFEKIYVYYLEHKEIKFNYQQRAYVSILCRSLKNYKNKEFRNVLIKKIVLIKIPSLQKRMAREFAKARRYINLV